MPRGCSRRLLKLKPLWGPHSSFQLENNESSGNGKGGAHQSCMRACKLGLTSRVRLFVTLWATAHQAPLSMGFSRQEYWRGLPCSPPGDLPNQDGTRVSYASCTDGQVGCLPLAPPGKLCEGACRSTDISDSRQFLLLQGSFNQPRPGSVAGSSLLSHMRELPQDRFFLVHTGVKLPPTESWRVR